MLFWLDGTEDLLKIKVEDWLDRLRFVKKHKQILTCDSILKIDVFTTVKHCNL